MSEFGQKVNNYSAYSVIMVPVSPAPEEEGEGVGGWRVGVGGIGAVGSPGRLSSSVMKYGQPRSVLHLDIY